MTVEYREGDLFAQDLPALGHGVNCRGSMGGGIARAFAQRWPRLESAYRAACQDGTLTLGGLFAWQEDGSPLVYNLATQDLPGADARLGAVRSAVRLMLEHAVAHHVGSIGLPRIGAGIGGLAWEDVRAEIEAAAAASPVLVVLVSRPGA